MNKEVFEKVDKIITELLEDKHCKIAQISVLPDGDPVTSIKTHVTIQFSYYDEVS